MSDEISHTRTTVTESFGLRITRTTTAERVDGLPLTGGDIHCAFGSPDLTGVEARVAALFPHMDTTPGAPSPLIQALGCADNRCRNCGRLFERRHPSQRFCSPVGRSKRHRCKDQFHNRNKHLAGEVTEARADYLEASGYQRPGTVDEGGDDKTGGFMCMVEPGPDNRYRRDNLGRVRRR